MSIKYDQLADAAYLCYSEEPVTKTVELNEYITIDFDKNNHVVGIEVISVSNFLKEKRMQRLSEKRRTKLQTNVTKHVIEAHFAT